MRKLILLFTIFLFTVSSCKTETKNPMDIINSSDITMTVEHFGCFNDGIRTITIRERDGIKTLTSISVSNNGLDIPKKTVPFNAEKESILADLIIAGNSLSDDGYCTSNSKYDIRTEKYKCFFEDKTCSLDEYLIKLIN